MTSIEEIISYCRFTPWAQKDTRLGPRMIRTAPIAPPVDKLFWKSWNADRASWYEMGYGVTKSGSWTLGQYLNPDGTVTQQARDMAIRAREEDGAGALPADWVPEDVELLTETAAKLLGYQRPAAMRLKRALEKWNALDASDTGCHAKGTLILIANGKLRPVEQIVPGVEVMGWDGTPRTVRSLARGREVMARIVPTKGESFEVNMSHLLTLQYSQASPRSGMGKYSGQIIDITVRDYLALGAAHKHCLKLIRRGVASWPDAETEIDPYHLGLLLGDGCMTTKDALSLTKPGPEMLAAAQEIAAAHGAFITTSWRTPTNPTHHFTNAKELWEKLDWLNLTGATSHDKFVPIHYRTGSTEQRRKMLAGLLDSDGSPSCGGYDFISASKRLSNDVAFIARSLGLAAYVKQCRKGCQTGAVGTYWRVSISGDASSLPLRLPHKRPLERKQVKDVLRTGFAVEILPEDDYYGFSLNGDGRFLLGDFTVTHNTGKTFVALVVAAELGMTPCVIAPLAVLPSWRRVAQMLGVRLGWLINYDKIRTGKSGLGKWQPANETEIGARGNRFVFTYLPGEKPLLVFDECHKAKAPDTKQGAVLRDAAKAGHRILCLSATAAKDPGEMRNLGATLGLHDGSAKAFAEFCLANGCRATSYGMKFDSRNRKLLERLHRQIFPLKGNRIRIADLPEFPETQILAETLTCETDMIAAAYTEMDRRLRELEHADLTSSEKHAEGMAAVVKARKVAEAGKLKLFAELTEEAVEEGKSVVVFLNFRDHVRDMMEAAKTDCVVWGGQKPEERQFCIDQFNRDERRVIVVSLMAGGAGLSLHDLTGNHPRLAIISPSYSAIDLKQALGRVHRAGALTKSFQRIIFAADTIEEEICRSVREKLVNVDTINDGHLAPPSILRNVLPGEAEKPQLALTA